MQEVTPASIGLEPEAGSGRAPHAEQALFLASPLNLWLTSGLL